MFSVFVDPIIADTGLSRVYISTLYAFGTAVSAAMVVIVARLVDRYGARVMLAIIALALGIAAFGMSAATGPVALLLGFAAMRALGQGSLPVTATMLTAQWFVKRRGRAMAVVILGLAASNALLPPIANYLIGSIGWRESYMVLGAMVWILLIPASLLIVRDRPEAMDLHPDGASEPADDYQPEETSPHRGALAVLRQPDFWLLAVPLSAVPFCVTALVFHQISILGEHGLSQSIAAGVFVPFAIASALATALSGGLNERLGPRVPLALSLVLLLVALLMLQTVSTPLAATFYAAVLGASAGVQGVTAGAIWAYYYGRRELGTVQGPATMLMISGAALAPLPLAALHQTFTNYDLALWLTAAVPVVCAVMLTLFDPKRARRRIEAH